MQRQGRGGGHASGRLDAELLSGFNNGPCIEFAGCRVAVENGVFVFIKGHSGLRVELNEGFGPLVGSFVGNVHPDGSFERFGQLPDEGIRPRDFIGFLEREGLVCAHLDPEGLTYI